MQLKQNLFDIAITLVNYDKKNPPLFKCNICDNYSNSFPLPVAKHIVRCKVESTKKKKNQMNFLKTRNNML